jgi:ligand-binding sensor domain-containing protein
MRTRPLILSLSLLLSLCLSAQQYGYVQYHSAAGAPFDAVHSAVQDAEGYVWIGSENGLYRFDGLHFEMFSGQTESQSIHQLHLENGRPVFVNDKGLYRVEAQNPKSPLNTLIEGDITESDSLPFYPNDFLIDQDGSIWLSQSNHRVGRWQPGSFRQFSFSSSDKPQRLALRQDLDGTIWALSPVDGLFRFNTSLREFERELDLQNGAALHINGDQLVIGGRDLTIYQIGPDRLRRLRTLSLEEDQVTAIQGASEGSLYVGTEKGKLYSLKDYRSELQTIYGANEAHRVEQLDFGQINEITLTTDSVSGHQKIWVSSATGLWLLQQRFFTTVESLPMNNPIGVSLNDRGKAWVPINYLYEISPEEEGFSAEPIFDNLQVNYVATDGETLWVTVSTPKVELLKFVNKRLVKRYDFHERGEAIFYLFPDSKGNLWFNQAPIDKPILGIAQVTADGQVKYYDETKGFTSRVLSLKESSRGEIYAVGIGEQSYLYRYDADQDRFENLSPELPFTPVLNFEAHDLTIDDRGIVWLATTDGLLRYDGEKVTLVQNDVLGQKEVRGVTHFANDHIWVATATEGLVFLQQNTSTVLGEPEGLPAVISAYRCITTDGEGRLWAGTAEGLVYSRRSAENLPSSHPPRIRRLLVDNQEISLGEEEIIRVRRRQQAELQLINLSFPAKNVQYQYRILPVKDKEILVEEPLWQTNDQQNVLQLRDIPVGDYALEIRARQPGGYRWSEPLEVQLKVYVPWIARSWVPYVLGGLGLALLAYYFRVYATRRLSRLQEVLKYSNEKLAKKEAQLNEKIKELEEQEEELESATTNIQTLELFIKGIPTKSSWEDIISAMGKAVLQTAKVNAFEIAFREKGEIVHHGYSDQERSGHTFRAKPFNAKTSLTCWAMANNQEVLINDFRAEHTNYVEEKDAYRYNSLLFIPFTLENDQPVVLCAYSTEINHFDDNDLVMFRILAKFIFFSIHQEISK